MPTPILPTKLTAPTLRPALVPRTHLLERLNAGLHNASHCRLTLVSAPAGFGKTTLVGAWMRQLRQPTESEILLTALVADIAAAPQPFLLVLDDYHCLHNLDIHQQVAFLVENQPPTLHLVIASREDPALPLARLRARDQVTELRQEDLRFSQPEASQLRRCYA